METSAGHRVGAARGLSSSRGHAGPGSDLGGGAGSGASVHAARTTPGLGEHASGDRDASAGGDTEYPTARRGVERRTGVQHLQESTAATLKCAKLSASERQDITEERDAALHRAAVHKDQDFRVVGACESGESAIDDIANHAGCS